ncbi:PREDICTED: probable serine/threonine-protein kinase dyrk1 [Ceratosolen solmsi marchali]|uniref:Probable serine/threonine-protein kinase dyrk1 n=1 Tax=Ceratosolen solmsi marchali TaxID=326594 RepID=A0AAJ6YNZ5_9HYME|nr:PREDICTED: probable serine/threonine-protein kinase dyrk1 [Ceratosolen solmsi marchali]
MSLSKETELVISNNEQIQQLTKERIRNIMQCRKDGFYRTTVPLAAVCALTSFMGLKIGVIPRAKCGILYQSLSMTLTAAVAIETYSSWLCIYKKYPNSIQNFSVKQEANPELYNEVQTYESTKSISFNENQSSEWDTATSNLNDNNDNINNNHILYREQENISESQNIQNTRSPALNQNAKKQTKYGDVWDE